MAFEKGVGIEGEEESKDFVDDDELLSSAIVLVLILGRIAVATFVTDADAVEVVATGVTSFLADGTTIIEGAVSPDVEMITGVRAKAACPVTGDELLDGEVLTRAGVAAVKDDEVNLPTGSLTIRTQQGVQSRP